MSGVIRIKKPWRVCEITLQRQKRKPPLYPADSVFLSSCNSQVIKRLNYSLVEGAFQGSRRACSWVLKGVFCKEERPCLERR